MKTNPILIGGAPCSGKSTLAKNLSHKLGITYIPTDFLRYLMLNLVNQKDYPALYNVEDVDPVEYLTTNTPKQIVDDENIRSKDVYKIIKLVIDRDYDWDSYIIEGVSITPELVNMLLPEYENIKYIFLVQNNTEQIRESIYKRGLWDDADKYPDSVKEIEVEWVIEYNKWLKEECEKYNLKYIEYKDREKVLDVALEILK